MTDPAAPLLPPENEDSRRGFAFALSAYLMWGMLPLFMKAVAHITPTEVIAHRVIWSLPIAGAVLVVLGRLAAIRAGCAAPGRWPWGRRRRR